MKLGEFVEQHIEKNCLVRLLYKTKSGHKLVLDEWDDVSMEWEILKGVGKNSHYISNEVIGVTSILTGGAYSESINIVIEKLDIQLHRELRLKGLLK